MKFILANIFLDNCKVLAIGEFESIDKAFETASKMANDMCTDVEVYELKRVANPCFVPSLDDQISFAWGQALIDSGMAGIEPDGKPL